MSESEVVKLDFTSLEIWPADSSSSLPSFDPECLCVLHIDIDDQYPEQGDLLALTALTKSNFIPAVLDTFWLDETYRRAVIDTQYSKVLKGFPLSFIYGKQVTNQLKNNFFLRRFQNGVHPINESNLEQIRKSIFIKGKEAIDLLAVQLGTKSFFFGSNPSSFDSLIFGYLAALIKSPATANSPLARYASNHTNLRSFVDRISINYLYRSKPYDEQVLSTENEPNVKNTTSKPKQASEERLRDKIAVISIGILTLCAYAYLSGLIRIEIHETE
ncbi:unnamed protein product [Didymodactylos carnosus]|uniref:Metaxin glutathione S-transferase domain-containing protein n=1 Tax=Didymodactylos carnosus TaxID=1234261 RepID=A0A813Q0X9_9BILA|nr:unnamed protein product [Didymodactylos carnosus]CAF0814469.1 unnamed protein product [Didymodactylos carnosus]CAF3540772.1 unnamed protein product [Didymodactylos carnosus]CAF3598440.1 unnamed protein product [Didymodactylos carnosus]